MTLEEAELEYLAFKEYIANLKRKPTKQELNILRSCRENLLQQQLTEQLKKEFKKAQNHQN